MTKIQALLIALPALAWAVAASAEKTAAEKPTAEELLKAADRARGATAEGISWDIVVEETAADKDANQVSYVVKVLGNDALAEAVAPARNKGEMMLFNDRTLWFFKPGLKKPVSISARQKLMGQAANGDIASTQYYRDYDGEVVGDETVDGTPTWKLELKAKAKNVTYDRIRYWIAKDKRLGVKAEFLTVGGDVFKHATFKYGNVMKLGDGEYPFVSEMAITDAINPQNRTVIKYASPRMEKHAASLFNVNNLMR